MRLTDLFEYQILTEMIWEDRFTAGEAVKRFPNAYIHFTKGIPHPMGDRGSKPTSPEQPKLGVNPTGVKGELEKKNSHSDAPGIYLYPCKFLASEDASIYQYATEYPFYYVCSFKNTDNTINLGNVSVAKTEDIARRNGWYSDMKRIRANPKILEQHEKRRNFTEKVLRKPGGFFWACAWYLANYENKSWMSLLKGIDAIIDPGYSIIAQGEPAQTIVFKRNLLTILAHGENKDKLGSKIASIAREIATEYNGKVSFKNKTAIVDLVIDEKPIRLYMPLYQTTYPVSAAYFKEGFWITDKGERDYSPDTGDADTFKQSVRYEISKALKHAEKPSSDMYWDADKVKSIIQMLKPNASHMSQYVNKGVFRLVYSDRNWGITDYMISGEINKNDILTMTFDFMIKTDDDSKSFKVVKRYKPNLSLEQVGTNFKKNIVSKLKQIGFRPDDPEGTQRLFKYLKNQGFDL